VGLSVAAERLDGNGGALTVIVADRALLGALVDGPGEPSAHGLTGPAEVRLHAALMKTPWASRCQRSFALVDGAHRPRERRAV
jgi:hypothetical protein